MTWLRELALGGIVAGIVIVGDALSGPMFLPATARPFLFVVGSGLIILGGIGHSVLRRYPRS